MKENILHVGDWVIKWDYFESQWKDKPEQVTEEYLSLIERREARCKRYVNMEPVVLQGESGTSTTMTAGSFEKLTEFAKKDGKVSVTFR